MSTGAIIAIVVIALIVVALLAVVIPRMRARAAERRLQARRDAVAGRHREEAQERELRADSAERQAARAEADAQKARAEAELHENRAQMHERGLADDRLGDEEQSVGGARPEADDERRFSRERDIAGERSADD